MIDKAKEKARRHRYYLAHQEERKAYQRQYDLSHNTDERRAMRAAATRKYYQNHREECLAQAHTRYLKRKSNV